MSAPFIPVVIEGCFAAYHAAPGPAVLFCPPFGIEAMVTARVWHGLAATLAAQGVAALRFDLPGTGDSAGDPCDPALLASWRRAIDSAAAWLAARHGWRISLFGHRFGALLAIDAVARGLGPERLVLLDPPASGAAFARGLRARARLEGHGVKPDAPLLAWEAPIAPAALGELASLPAPLSPQAALPPTLLVLDQAAPCNPWPDQLRAAGAAVTIQPFEGYEAFVQRTSLDAVEPRRVLAEAAAFLAPAEPHKLAGAPPEPGALVLPGLCEQGLHFGPDGGLFGILCLPDGRSHGASANAPIVLLPSVGDRPRSGNGRNWTDLARLLARHGIASFRLDLAGVGDSAGAAVEDKLVAGYHPDRVADIRAALDAVAGRGFTKAVLIGLCSGAYVAWLAAAADARITGMLAINPQYFSANVPLSRAAVEGASVREEISLYLRARRDAGEAPHPMTAGTLPHLARRVKAALAWRTARAVGCRPAEARRAQAHLDTLLRRGVHVEFLFASADSGLRSFQRAFGTPPVLPASVPVTLFDGADHLFGAPQHRTWLLDFAARFALRFASTTPAAYPGKPSSSALETAA